MVKRKRIIAGTRLRAKTRAFQYPADPESLRLVRAAGGISKLSRDDAAKVTLKTVAVGEWCDDMPTESIPARLERGEVEYVTVGSSRELVTSEEDS